MHFRININHRLEAKKKNYKEGREDQANGVNYIIWYNTLG